MALGFLNDELITNIANEIRDNFGTTDSTRSIKVADIPQYIGTIPKFESSIVESIAPKISFGSNSPATIYVNYTSISRNGQCAVKQDKMSINSYSSSETNYCVVRGTAINITLDSSSSLKIDSLTGSWYGSNIASDGKSARIVCSPSTSAVTITFR